MKNKGRRYKRAINALNKIHLNEFSNYSKGYVLSVSKKNPNYFTAMIFDSCSKKWVIAYCGYLSSYMYLDGSFVKDK